MKIEHIALWTRDLERSRHFYQTYFDGMAGEKYVNVGRGFESYFLTFDSGSRLELMQMPGIADRPAVETVGWAHVAFAVGDERGVDNLTGRLRADGYTIISEPRRTGDGYYESVVLDPDGNHIEITV